MEDKKEELKGIGEIDDKYIIIQKLSYGGQANVFSVKEIETNKIYAVKIPKYDNQSFKKEDKIIGILKEKGNQNIINSIMCETGIVKRVGRKPEKKNYLILELMKNRSLDEYVRFLDHGFGERYSKVIFYKIVKAFQSIHKDGISHRDIKLDNILLDDKFNPKISDFGYAVEYSNKLVGNLGTKIYKAPELNKAYDGYAIDVFSLGITLLTLTYRVPVFEAEPSNSRLYKCLRSKNEKLLKIFWEVQAGYDENINQITDEFKDLFYKMVEFNPKKRITIGEILKHKWFGNIPNMNEKELEEYEEEIKLKEEFERRKKIVDVKVKDEIKNNIEESNDEYDAYTRSGSDSENDYFNKELKLKLIEKGKYMNYIININGELNPRKFMNLICDKIQVEFPDCFIEIIKSDEAKIDITFREDLIPEEIKNKIEELGIENEEKEENEEDQKEINIRIKLYKTSDGYLIRFVNKEGDKNDFIDKFEKISHLVKKLIE